MFIIFAVVLFLAAILFSSLRVSVAAVYGETDANVVVKAAFWFMSFTVYKSGEEKPEKEKEEVPPKKEGEQFSMENVEGIFHTFMETFKKLKKRLIIRRFTLKVMLGMTDAANTGIMTGAAWATLYNMIGLLGRHFTLKEYEVEARPSFNKERFDVFFEGVFSIRVIFIFGILASAAKMLGKTQKAESINI